MSHLLILFYNAITIDLQDIPNQPIVFSADPKKKRRSEDAMIAFTWAHFINDTKSPYWLARMPMTKAGVRAMYVQHHTELFVGIYC